MAIQVRKGPKIVLVILGIAALLFGIKYAFNHGMVPGLKEKAAVVPTAAVLPEARGIGSSATFVAEEPLPSPRPLGVGSRINYLVWAWNSQMGLMLANGGPTTTEGSLMAKNGVKNLVLTRQDDAVQMQSELLKFAKALKDGNPQPTEGAHFVAIMGDGAAAFLAGINPQLAKLGPEYTAVVVGSAGYSRGEDKFMGLPEWKANPQSARGAVVAGYLRDGDWNIAIKWCADNGIPNNPDEKTYDPNALNWVAADTYIDAAQKYINGYSEERPVVKNGKRTGDTKRITVNGVVTWTPGDVMVAKNKGGLVSVVSTKEYFWQMPNTIIGIKKWTRDNRSTVEGMLAAIFAGGDQVKTYPQALRKAAEISAAVYKEETADYWEKYYRGTTESDRTGLAVELGGSSVNNLADDMYLFGLLPGSSNIFASVYKVFGDIVVQQYPELVPNYPPVSDILDTSFVAAVGSRKGGVTVAQANVPKYSATPITDVVSRRSVTINFRSGSAEFSSDALMTLSNLYDQLVATSLKVEVHGHTDSVGGPEMNMGLSERRAFAVKQWMETKSSTNFPDTRISVFAHGQTNPVASNDTEDGRARNRRVEIVLGK